MKKILFATIIICLLLTACSNGITDGNYTAQMTSDDHGWTDTLSVTYEGGKVQSATFESIHEDGSLKSETTPEEYPMDPHPSEWIPTLSENIKNADNADSIDGIAGATIGTTNAKLMMKAIEEKAKAGDTDTAMVSAE